MTDLREQTAFIDERPALWVTLRVWRDLAPQVLAVVLLAYLLTLPMLALPAGPKGGGELLEWLRSALAVGSGWFGQACVGWLVLRWACGYPSGVREALRAVVGRFGSVVLLGLVRALLVYTPLFLLGALLQWFGKPEPGKPSPVPAAILVLVPFVACVGALLSTTATATMVGRRPVREILGDAWRAGDAVFPGLFPAAGLLLVVAVGTSLLPLEPVVYLPNHFLGSLLWVLLPVYYLRAVRRREDDSLQRLAEALGEPVGGLTGTLPGA